MKRILILLLLSMIVTSGSVSCGDGSGSGLSAPTGGNDDGGGGDDITTSGSWTGSSNPLTINDIVNSGTSSSNVSLNVTVSPGAAFYFGRFIYDDEADIHCGSFKFKLNKENDNLAFFSDVSLENMSTVINGTSNNPEVVSNVDLDVTPTYNVSLNHVEIANATSRFVEFDVDFGNNDYFPDIVDAGVMFSSNFLTMAGGNNANFFFIAQKADSQPNVTNSDIVDDWSARRFTVSSSSGAIAIESSVSINILGINSQNLNPFTGTDAVFGNFNGLAGLTDNQAGCFAYTFGSTIDGGFILSADNSLAVGYDLTSNTYFAMQR